MAYELGVDLDNGQLVAAVHHRGDTTIIVDRPASPDLVDDLREVRNTVGEAQGIPPRSTVVVHATALDGEALEPLRFAVSQMGLDRVGLLPRAAALAFAPTGAPDLEAGSSLAVIEFGEDSAVVTRLYRRGTRWKVDATTETSGLAAKHLVATILDLDPEVGGVLVAGGAAIPSGMAAALERRLEIPVEAVTDPTMAAAGGARAATDRWVAKTVRPAIVPVVADVPDPEEPATGLSLAAGAPPPDSDEEEPTRRRGALLLVAALIMVFGGVGAVFAANLLGSDDPEQLDTRRLDLTGGEVPSDPEPARFEVGLDDGKPVVLGAVEARKPTTSTTAAPAPAPRPAPRRAPAPAPTTAAPTTTAPTTQPTTTTLAPTTTLQPTTTLAPPSTQPTSTTSTTIQTLVEAGEADFTWSPKRPRELQAVPFSDRSEPAPVLVTWTFPDGTTAQGPEVFHTFTDNGRKRVTMTACWDQAGEVCRTRNRTVSIRNAARGDADFVWSPRAPTVGTSVSFTAQADPPAVTALWLFPDGTSSTAINPTKTFNEPGDYEVKAWLCWDLNGDRCRSRTHEIEVLGEVVTAEDRVASSAVSPPVVFAGFPVELIDTSSPTPSSVVWTFPDGQQFSGSPVRVSFEKGGERKVTSEVCWTGPDECQTTEVTVEVIAFDAED